MRTITLIAALAVVALFVDTAHAGPFTKLWVFGDSSVDAGWYETSPYSGVAAFDAYFPQSSTYGFGKPTTNPGKISVQVLAHIIGLHAMPQNQGGTDYGTGGARNHDTNLAGSGLFLNAVPTETQIDNYVGAHTPAGTALYVISSGGNDVEYALTNPNFQFGDPGVIGVPAVQANEQAYVVGVADTLASKIASVQANNNVKYVIVTKLAESFGTPPFKQQLRAAYNAELKGQLDSQGVTYAWADVNAVRLQINASPSDFGIDPAHLSNASGQRACTDPDPGLGVPSGFAFLCSSTSPVSAPISTAIAKKSLFSDDQHYATGGQRVFGSYYYCLAKNTWPSLFTGNPAHKPPIACSKFFP